ncbi:MAG: type II toxin-antitoxin system VapC family toxin [Dehalococcoidia bacterium]
MQRFRNGLTELTAPTHIMYEVPSAITVATRGTTARLTQAQGDAAIEAFLGIPIPTQHSADLVRQAYRLAKHLGLAFYDGLYAALAQQLGIHLITADRPSY